MAQELLDLALDDMPLDTVKEGTGGIYQIVNNVQFDPDHPKYHLLRECDYNGYVGGTSKDELINSLASRYPQGLNSCTNKEVLKAIEIFGEENFTIEWLERDVPKAILGDKEREWAREKNCVYPNGYNEIEPAGGSWNYHTGPNGGGKTVKMRNIKTNKVFTVTNLLQFSKDPLATDPDYDPSYNKKSNCLNYRLLSNVFTGYKSKDDAKRGQHRYPEKIHCGCYCPAKYTLTDLEKIKAYKVGYRKSRKVVAKRLKKYKIEGILDLKTLELTTFETDQQIDEFCREAENSTMAAIRELTKPTTVNRQRKVDGLILSRHINKKLIDSPHFWKYDDDGEFFDIKLISPENKEYTIKSNDSSKFAEEMCSQQNTTFESLRRLLTRLISGKINIGGGWKVVEGQKFPSRLNWTRYCNNKYIRGLIRQGLMSEDFQLINPVISDVGISYNKLKDLFKL